MRSICSALALVLACACGNLSNEDVAFQLALPRKDQLHVRFPAAPAGQNACAIGTADVYANAKTTGDSINSGVDAILTLVDTIRGVTPTSRDADSRTWGPFADNDHPGVKVQVVMSRELDAAGIPWRFVYTISAARPPGAFLPVLEGEFFGAQAQDGTGRLTLHFENSKLLSIDKPGDPALPARVYYDLSSDPRTVSLDLTAGANGFGLVSFDYGFAGYADGHGRFDYAFPDPKSGCTVEVTTNFTAQGAGRDVFRLRCGAQVSGDVQQCWDATSCLTYVNDPFAFTAQCLGISPCLIGTPAQCPAGL